MPFAISHLVERSGVSARTIRKYIRIKLMAPPEGRGPSAFYSDRQLYEAICIAGLRAEGAGYDAIAAQVPGWSLVKLRAQAHRYEKAREPPPPAPPVADPGPGAEPMKDPRGLPRETGGEGQPIEVLPDGDLPDGPRWALVSLLPGMALMVRDDAAAIVKRAAREIIAQYGSRP